MKGYICDRCGEPVTGDVARLSVMLETGRGRWQTDVGDDCALDLCEACGQVVAAVIENRIVTAKTLDGAWSLPERGRSE